MSRDPGSIAPVGLLRSSSPPAPRDPCPSLLASSNTNFLSDLRTHQALSDLCSYLFCLDYSLSCQPTAHPTMFLTDLVPSRCSKCPFVEKGDSSTEEEAQKSSLTFELTALQNLSLPGWFIYSFIFLCLFVIALFIPFIFLTVFRLSIDVT